MFLLITDGNFHRKIFWWINPPQTVSILFFYFYLYFLAENSTNKCKIFFLFPNKVSSKVLLIFGGLFC
jgi:hypothetical protein